jgi:hypothetical protein
VPAKAGSTPAAPLRAVLDHLQTDLGQVEHLPARR